MRPSTTLLNGWQVGVFPPKQKTNTNTARADSNVFWSFTFPAGLGMMPRPELSRRDPARNRSGPSKLRQAGLVEPQTTCVTVISPRGRFAQTYVRQNASEHFSYQHVRSDRSSAAAVSLLVFGQPAPAFDYATSWLGFSKFLSLWHVDSCWSMDKDLL